MDQDKVKARSLDTTDMAEQVLSIEAQNAKWQQHIYSKKCPLTEVEETRDGGEKKSQ
jgi:hypothetical protein